MAISIKKIGSKNPTVPGIKRNIIVNKIRPAFINPKINQSNVELVYFEMRNMGINLAPTPIINNKNHPIIPACA